MAIWYRPKPSRVFSVHQLSVGISQSDVCGVTKEAATTAESCSRVSVDVGINNGCHVLIVIL